MIIQCFTKGKRIAEFSVGHILYKSHISEYDEAYYDLQQLDSFDTNLILLKHKLDPIDANWNSQKRKLHDGRI